MVRVAFDALVSGTARGARRKRAAVRRRLQSRAVTAARGVRVVIPWQCHMRHVGLVSRGAHLERFDATGHSLHA